MAYMESTLIRHLIQQYRTGYNFARMTMETSAWECVISLCFDTTLCRFKILGSAYFISGQHNY